MANGLEKWRADIDGARLRREKGIYIYENPAYLQGDNSKYMKMYNWMALGYDFAASSTATPLPRCAGS